MSITAIAGGKALKAEDLLAFQLKTRLGVDVDPAALRDFIVKHWTYLSHLAHSIHADAEYQAAMAGQEAPGFDAGVPVA